MQSGKDEEKCPNLTEEWAKYMKIQFTENIQMIFKHMRSCLSSFVIKVMYIKLQPSFNNIISQCSDWQKLQILGNSDSLAKVSCPHATMKNPYYVYKPTIDWVCSSSSIIYCNSTRQYTHPL